MNRAYFSTKISDFCSRDSSQILGQIVENQSFDITNFQKSAWIEQSKILKDILLSYEGHIYFEFSIPRMGKRIDAVIIIGPVVFIVEFKVGETTYKSADVEQVMDYALDLHNFHEGSHNVILLPILVATNAADAEIIFRSSSDSHLYEPVLANAKTLSAVIRKFLGFVSDNSVNVIDWEGSRYKPTPTIIEATLALYNGHSVVEISRSDASAQNLSDTSETVSKVIERSKQRFEKSIIFVTGVPGAGKTLVGLDIATRHINRSDELYSVFLSGNGPLVKILQEALARDKVNRKKLQGEKIRKGEALSEVKAFIQNVHHFRDEGLVDLSKPPIEHVAIFDEAQRAWSKNQTIKFMKEKKNQVNFNQSEPEFLISCMDRHRDWATIIGLVGGGQEINTGEAGISEWFEAVEHSFPDWKIFISDQLTDIEYGAGEIIRKAQKNENVTFLPSLHLKTSVRSFRSEKVSQFVKDLLDLEIEKAKVNLLAIKDKYPIKITRDLDQAKEWVRKQARGSERYGMLVSSQAERLKPYAIDVRVNSDPVHWFLNGKEDVRSSYYLEDVATEFDVQGLELDWVCVAWDADFRFNGQCWENWSFRGDRWQKIKILERQRYQKNAYRVLLTRARQGLVLFVPTGNDSDHTRPRSFYDQTFEYLKKIGVEEI